MARILRTPQADADLAEIWSYIARGNPPAADRLIRQISETFDLLAGNPDLGIRQDDIRSGLRCKPVRRHYLVFYEAAGDAIHILRVLHGARKYEDLLWIRREAVVAFQVAVGQARPDVAETD